ncbi:MAG: hypothetical protein ABR530_05395, partial [Pyrinomonadaceae bacterium]
TSNFVFARGWLLEIIELDAGEYAFIADGEEISSEGRRFGVFYPSFTLVRPKVKDLRGRVSGIGSVTPDDRLPSFPFIFETDLAAEFTHVEQV